MRRRIGCSKVSQQSGQRRNVYALQDGTESKEELERDGSEQVPPKRQLFFKGQPTDIMVLVLQVSLPPNFGRRYTEGCSAECIYMFGRRPVHADDFGVTLVKISGSVCCDGQHTASRTRAHGFSLARATMTWHTCHVMFLVLIQIPFLPRLIATVADACRCGSYPGQAHGTGGLGGV